MLGSSRRSPQPPLLDEDALDEEDALDDDALLEALDDEALLEALDEEDALEALEVDVLEVEAPPVASPHWQGR